MDVYDSFKFVNDAKYEEMGIKGDGLDYSAFIEASQMLGNDINTTTFKNNNHCYRFKCSR